jgi:hypothetical protein
MKSTIQEKRLKRVKQTAEVFTPLPLVLDMLNKLPDAYWNNPHATTLEHSCGDGIFIINIILKRLNQYKQNIEDIIMGIHGRDIMKDNIEITRTKVIEIIIDELNKMNLPKTEFNKKLIKLTTVLFYNIHYTKDTLKEDFDKLKPYNHDNPTKKMDVKVVEAIQFLNNKKYI